ncbi:NAD-dependent epimerase/dehydratase family protein [Tessaracoccus rhinocerotis]|uniref:NAD-dependent epimerase/dehydratase family protein n=1 Tax=Tessaracoccus rhinocerotis TaxID=1689449 RepID=A0A553K0Y3_9ACTN|nr:NAD-dependent epimerase/dehydratase family protein [Tessaracoccus rhinocerotis]TRY18361.1 NAD-dependent epimerase/dehydratase family protein [Tessaracoccus rhinocerotis]
MRILVTGATGFVGRHLVRALAHDHEVIAVARRPVEVPGADEVLTVPSIDSATDWSGLLEDVEMVVHLAARVHVMQETSDEPLEAFREINVRGTRRLAKACVDQGVRRLVFLSSIKVNGEVTQGSPFRAGDDPAPVDPYGVSKLEAEQALAEVAAGTRLEVVVLRPTVIYGAGVKGNVQRLMRLIETRIPIPLGAVRNARSMLSIGNLITWITESIRADDVPGSVVLVADPEPVSTPSLIRALAEGMGYRTFQIPVPIALLNLAGRLVGQSPALQRLTGDLVVEPTTGAFPQVGSKLKSPRGELVSLGKSSRNASGSVE